MSRWIEGIVIGVTLLRIARLIGARLNSNVKRRNLIQGLGSALSDGHFTHVEWESLGAELGVFERRAT